MNQFETFLQLHYDDTPLVLGNAWNVTSAVMLERNGFKAVATSSRAIAHSMGYEDGEHIPYNFHLQIVERIINNINVPLTVDIEGGYGRNVETIIQNIEKLHGLGVVGFNLEDSMINEKGKLQRVDDFQRLISSVMNHLERKNTKMFFNARTDSFLQRLPSALDETIKRIKAYENAGATGIFVPFITNKSDIKAVVNSTSLPVNVLCRPQLFNLKELTELGVKRVSMGGALHDAATKSLEKILHTIQEDQSFECFF